MICQVISTGTEIMNGTTLDTNSNYIMRTLYDLGIEVDQAISISDDRDKMYRAISRSFKEADLIYIIGGLGPTEDDHTKDIVGDILNKKLVMDENLLKDLEKSYAYRGIKMPENNRQQALVIEDALILENNLGTAPGLFIKKEDKKIFLFPGPPREMIPMFEESLVYIEDNFQMNYIETINTIDIGESKLELIIRGIERPRGLEVLTYAKDRRVDIQLLYKEDFNQDLVSSYRKRLESKLGSHIYGKNYKSLEEIFMAKAREKSLKIALAESCTGGLLSNRLTDIEGASKTFERGLVTYTRTAKVEELDVSWSTLDRYGAVSGETAIEMAQGIRRKAKVDLAISITGVAGPGREEGKEEGLVYIGISTEVESYSRKYHFKGGRKDVKSLASSQALIDGIKAIEKI